VYRNGATGTGVRSTTTKSGRGTVSRRPQGKHSAANGRSAGPSSHRQPVHATLTWVGRGEPWVRIEVDGRVLLRPGTMRLFELILFLNGWERA
jgi:hypothetical protein